MKERSILLTLLFSCISACAQLPDVPAAFAALSPDPQVLHLRRNHIKVPSGGHLQGIQALSDSIFVITGSSASFSYYLTVNKAQVTSIRKISDAPFRHAGGCQIFGDHLAVGVEDNIAKNRSNIIDILLDAKANESSKVTVLQRQGIFKRSTAGAVGALFRYGSHAWVMAVADWDSRNIDFYYSVGDSIAMASAANIIIPVGWKWCSYQSINLLTDSTGKIYLIGFGLDGSKNRADLFEVDLNVPTAQLKLLSTRNFKCKGTSFRYGSGIYISPNHKLAIYSIARNVGANTAVNIFR